MWIYTNLHDLDKIHCASACSPDFGPKERCDYGLKDSLKQNFWYRKRFGWKKSQIVFVSFSLKKVKLKRLSSKDQERDTTSETTSETTGKTTSETTGKTTKMWPAQCPQHKLPKIWKDLNFQSHFNVHRRNYANIQASSRAFSLNWVADIVS